MKNFNVFSDKNKMKRYALAFALLLLTAAASAQENGTADTLAADVLAKNLYAKNSDEQMYCAYVVQLRDNKTLPEKIFYAVYYRAIEKEKARRFTYFRTGLEILCKREGVVLPEFSAVQTNKNSAFVWTNTTTPPAVNTSAAAPTTAKKPFAFFYSWFKR